MNAGGSPAKPCRILLASIYPIDGVGGLAQYQRILMHEFNGKGKPGASVVVLPSFESKVIDPVKNDPSGFHSLTTDSRFRICSKLFPRLASRSTLHPILKKLMEWVGSIAARRSQCLDIKVVHFIGTGWHMHGFWLAAFARYRGCFFTVLPAVHPHSWGDDVIDVRLYRLADRVLCLSDYERQHLINLGVSAEKLVRCSLPPMCLSAGDGRSLRARRSLGDRPIVLFLGRRDRDKGYPILLKAWNNVIDSVQDAILLVAGPSGEEFEDLKSSLPSDSIRDLGVPDEQMKADALSACNIFCLPSAHESFGIVYVEAWSYGKPVICGTAPASRELIQNEKTGLWSTQESESLAKIIVRLLRDRSLANNLGMAGKRLQELKFTRGSLITSHREVWNC